MIRLTNQLLQATPAARIATPDGAGTVAPVTATGAVIQAVSTNGTQEVTVTRLQSQPLSSASLSSATVGTEGLMSPLDFSGGCVRPGSGLLSWWQGEWNVWDSLWNNPGDLVVGFDEGMVGTAFSFDGSSQSVQVPYLTSPACLATPSFTIECWVCPLAQSAGQAFIFGQAYGRQLVVTPGGEAGMWVSLYVADLGGIFHGTVSPGEIFVDQWTHLAGTYDGTDLKLYINGALVAQIAPELQAILDSACPFSIGGINDACGYSGQYFCGLIDEVSVYDRALFHGEIEAIYQAGSEGKCKTQASCAACPGSAVAWWPGEGNASDALGNHAGTAQNGAGYDGGMTGQAFSFDGVNQAVEIAHDSSFFATPAFSVEAWVNPSGQVDQAFIFGQSYGGQLIVRSGNRGLSAAFVVATSRIAFYEVDSTGEIPLGQWTHLVGTWDGVSTLSLYINGALDQAAPLGVVPWDSGCPFHIGGIYDPEGGCAYQGQFFPGLIDETTYYSQALSPADVQALYNAGSEGKCPVPPAITSQPESQTVTAGNDAILRVSATGSSLNYQWFNGEAPLWSETPSTLYLANVGMANAGTYTVQVWNDSGWVISEDAVLTVVPAVPFATPAGAVAWWRADGDDPQPNSPAEDCVGNNDAEREGTCYSEDGKVGRMFMFGPTGDLLVPARDSLNSTDWDGFTIEGWLYPFDVDPWQPILEQWDSGLGRRITLSFSASGPGSLEVTWVDSSGTHQLGSPPGVVRDDTFQHFALAYYDDHAGSTFLKLYLNGQLVAENTAQLGMALGANAFYFGKSPYTFSLVDPPPGTMQPYFGYTSAGYMDELTIYNRALDETEIRGIYNAGSAGKTPPCTAAPANCRSWWQGEGDGSDVYAENTAIPEGGVTFSPGNTGQAFTFAGSGGVRVPASASLDVGAGTGFTVEAWVKPASVSAAQPILEWNLGVLTGVAIWISDGGMLCANIRDMALYDHPLPVGGSLAAGVFHHVALTYEGGTARLYLNGTEVGEQSVSGVPLTKGDMYFGFSPADDEGQYGSQLKTGTQFAGQIDEVALYTPALTAAEIRKLYTAGGGGKCGIPPTILTQPETQTANVGNNVAFRVVAKGASLSYQWFVNGGGGAQQIPDATGAALVLGDVQASQAGTYWVEVTGSAGVARSDEAGLTVSAVSNGAAPTISTQPESKEVCEDTTLELSVSATASSALRYQWRKNRINLNGYTGSTYSRSDASVADAGTYSVVVYSEEGQVTSADAVVAVHPRPTALVAGNATVSPGFATFIWAVLTGTGPWNLTWFDGTTETTETGVADNPHARRVVPVEDTTYTLTGLSDAHCSTQRPEDLSGSATIILGDLSLAPPMRAGLQRLTGNHTETHTDLTLAGDTTYLVDGSDGPVHLTGTTTIEPGTVVKFASHPDARIIIDVSDATGSRIVCKAAPYAPAVFCYGNNDDFGFYGAEEYPSPGPCYGQGLSLAGDTTTPVVLKNLRFFNLACGVSFDGNATFKLYDCQFADCETALTQSVANASIGIYNALFADDTTVCSFGQSVSAANVVLQHVTVDGCGAFASSLPASGTWNAVNSLLVFETGDTIPTGIQGSRVSPATGMFTTGSDGSHYLPEASSFRDSGTTSIDQDLLQGLPQKTTHPPLTLPWFMQISGSLTFSPQVPRYVPEEPPDRGYYYDALDYTVSAMQVTGGTITVLPGTAIGLRYDFFFGFDLWEGSSFVSHGFPNKPVTFTTVSAVQEGPFLWNWTPGFQISFMPNHWPYEDYNPQGDPPPTLDFRFSNLYLTAGVSHHFWSGMPNRFFGNLLPWRFLPVSSAMDLHMRDCHLLSGWFHLGEPNGNVVWPPADQGGQPIPGSVSLVNNLFERVNTSLDPDTGPGWWPPGEQTAATIDLSLAATNNTFRGGWLFVAPTLATAGNWIFQNNLFDKVVLARHEDQPLDAAHNAYWPCRPADDPDPELFPGQIPYLSSTLPAQDFILSGEPPYAAGPLGHYYMDAFYKGTTTPTGLQGAGSCSPAQVGLYHYTTRPVAQTREADSAQVDIGLHYLVTTSTASREPQDQDNDGIPDYVENWHGDGDGDGTGQRPHTGTETDWRSDSSTLGADGVTYVEDKYSAAYDDVDLEGDGLTGAVERALTTEPLIQDNPLGGAAILLPDTVSGLVTVPLGITSSVEDGVFMEFRVNAQPTAATVQKVSDAWVARWDTTLLANGVYWVAIEVQAGGNSGAAACPGKLVTVQNAISFPDASLTVGDTLTINAQTIYTNGTWTMDIYDDQGVLFDSLAGDVDENGFCDYPDTSQQGVSVSLLDGDGNPLPSDYYTVVVTTSASEAAGGSAAGSASATTIRYYEKPWNTYRPGKWVIVYAPLYDADSEGSADQSAIVSSAVDAVYRNVSAGGSYANYGEAVIGIPGPAWGGNYALRKLKYPADWTQFTSDLSNVQARNLFYFGHCKPEIQRGTLHGGDYQNRDLSTDALRLVGKLHNSLNWDNGAANGHPYRFVFICACSSAKTDLPLAFGIPKVTMSSVEFTKKFEGLPPRAFLGFNGDIPVGGILGRPRDYMDSALKTFLTNFWANWTVPEPGTGRKRTLKEAVDAGKKAANAHNPNSAIGLGISPQIYGCSDLLFDQR